MKLFNYLMIGLMSWVAKSTEAQTPGAENTSINLSGYVKNLHSSSFIRKIDSNSSVNIIHNRLNAKFYLLPKLTARLETRNRIFYGEQLKITPNFGNTLNQYDGLLKLSHLWINEKSFVAHSVIDRLLLNYSFQKWNVTIGRQRINWGINNIWNPNDIFNAYNFLDFDYEERPGNDAFRIQRNLKNNAEIELAYKPGKTKDENTAALLYKFNTLQYDFQLLGGICKKDFVVGGGWAGNIKQAGFKGEMSYFISKNSAPESNNSFSISLMADKSFTDNWYGAIGCLYNSSPTNIFLLTESSANVNLSSKQLFPFRYNFYTTVVKTFSPIMTFTISTIYAAKNNTFILLPVFNWNAANNFDVDFIAQSLFAKQNSSQRHLITQINIRSRWSF